MKKYKYNCNTAVSYGNYVFSIYQFQKNIISQQYLSAVVVSPLRRVKDNEGFNGPLTTQSANFGHLELRTPGDPTISGEQFNVMSRTITLHTISNYFFVFFFWPARCHACCLRTVDDPPVFVSALRAVESPPALAVFNPSATTVPLSGVGLGMSSRVFTMLIRRMPDSQCFLAKLSH